MTISMTSAWCSTSTSARAGAAASRAALAEDDSFFALPLENPPVEAPSEPLDLDDIRNSLKSLMWRSAGVWRDGERLREALASIESWRRYVLTRQLAGPAGWELQNMVQVAELMIHAALERKESRGVHLRTDFPAADDRGWLRHVGIRRAEAGPAVSA